MVMKKKIFIIVMTNNMPGISAWQKHCCEKKPEKTERNLKNIMTMTKKGYKKKKQDQ